MKPTAHVGLSRAAIISFYKKATYSYLTPLGLVLLGFLWDFFLLLALFTLLPCSLIGLYFTRAGFALASKQGDLEKKDVGYANMLLGAILFVLSLLSIGLAYMMTS